MADVATLGIEVQNGSVIQATRALDGLTVAGAKTEAATQRLTRRMALQEIEARKMDAAFDEAARSSHRLTINAGGLHNALQALAGGIVVRSLLAQADAYTNLHSRLAIVTADAANLAAVEQSLFAVSQATRTGLESNVALYASLARSTKALGLSQADLVSVTRTIAQSFIVSGASAQETDAAVRQLGQAFASGVLRGDEFNSIAENAPRLQQAVAASLGVTIGQLRQMAKEGELTGAVLAKALLEQGAAINAEFEKMPTTVGGAMTRIRNAMLLAVGDTNAATGATGGLVEMLTSLANAIPAITKTVNAFFGGIAIQAVHAAASVARLTEAFKVNPKATIGGLIGSIWNGGDFRLMALAGAQLAQDTAPLNDALDQWVAEQEKLILGLNQTTGAIDTQSTAVKTLHPLTAQQIKDAEALRKAQEQMNHELAMSYTTDIRLAKQGLDFFREQQRMAAEAGATAAAAQEQAIALAQREADAMAQPFQNLAENIQRTMGDTFAQVFRDGAAAFRNLFDVARDIMARLAGEMVSLFASKKLIPLLLGTTAFGSGGGVGNTNPVSGLGAGIARDAALGGLAGGFLGYGIGSMTTSRTLGALGGTASGALAGFAVAGPIGAATGALTGFIGGVLGAGNAAREAAKQQELLRQAYKNTQAQIAAQLSGDTLAQSEAQIHAQFDAYRQQARAAAGSFAEYMSRQGMDPELTSKFGNNLNENLKLLNEQEAAFIEKAREAAALQLKTATEDLQVRLLVAQGRDKEAAALKLQLDQERERAALLKSFGDTIDPTEAATLALFDQVQAQEKLKAATDAANKSALNMVEGYNLQRLVFANASPFSVPNTTTTGGGGFTPTHRTDPSGGMSAPMTATFVVNLDGREIARSTRQVFKRDAALQLGDTTRWGETQ